MRNFKIAIITTLCALILVCGGGYVAIRVLFPELLGVRPPISDTQLESSSVPEEVENKIVREYVTSGFEEAEADDTREFLKDSLPKFTEELGQAYAQNNEVLAWLNVPNTNMSYPIPINMSHTLPNGELDPEYYLQRSYTMGYAPDYDEKSAIYADVRNNLRSSEDMSPNTILYGHNWTNIENGSTALRVANSKDKMFAQLPSFADIDFAQSTTYFTIDLLDEQLVYVIFAAMYVDTYNPDHKNGYYYLDTDPSDLDLGIMIEEARRRSEHLYRVPVGVEDKIVTLSTCTLKFGSNRNQRFVVMGRLLHEDEDIVDFPPPVKNPYPKRPNI